MARGKYCLCGAPRRLTGRDCSECHAQRNREYRRRVKRERPEAYREMLRAQARRYRARVEVRA